MVTSTSVRDLRSPRTVGDISRRRLLQIGAVTGAGIVLAAPAMSGCDVSDKPEDAQIAGPPSKPTGVLRVANNGEPMSLDPSIGGADFDWAILARTVYESLVEIDDKSGHLRGVLVDSFESSPDSREWVFRLKRGISFHDGEALTSSEVKTSLQYFMNNGGPKASYLPAKTTFDDSDPTVLRVVAPSPFPDLARNVAALKIISPKLIKAGPEAVAKTPTGTGPFRFVSYKTATSVVMEANPNYRGPGPYVERLEFLTIPDDGARLSALRSGSVDLLPKVNPGNAADLRADPSVVVTQKPVWLPVWLFMFTQTPPLDNLKVRQAMAHAIDRPALIKAILNGIGSLDDSWVSPGIYGHRPPKTTYPYDPERAKQLLAESGLPAPIKVILPVSPEGDDSGRQTIQSIAGMLEKVGFKVTVKTVPNSELYKVVTSPPGTVRPFHALYTGAAFDTGSAAQLLLQRTIETLAQFTDPVFTTLRNKVLITSDGPERLRLFSDIERRIADKLPLLKLSDWVWVEAHGKAVQGSVTPFYSGSARDYAKVYLTP